MSTITRNRYADSVSGKLKPVLVILLIVAALAVVFLATRGGSTAKPADNNAKAYAGPFELAAADVAMVEQRSLSRSLPLSGSLTPLVQATVKSRVSGDVLEMLVREGQVVNKGEVLARIDIRNLGAQFDSQRASLDKARADLALAKTNRDTSAAMLKEKFISQNAFDSAQSGYDAAAASVKVAEAQARLAQIGLDDAVVRAPISGIVSQRMAQPGEKVSPDSPLLAIVDLGQLELEVPAPASEIPLVAIGQTGSFKVGGYGERVFTAKVERINPSTDAGTRSIKLYLSVDNADGALRGGMFAQGELVLDQSAPSPTVPTSAIRSDSGVSYVLAVEQDKLVRHTVTLGLKTDDNSFVEIRDGVSIGSQVLAAKIDALHDGSTVVFAKASAPPATAPAVAN
ncbi:MAG: efflux RND transporter periplasmic adaptor subunit [Nevskia sp.]|nr:efflux RND transporter periplasmic adaptor subunit [Nevskia sp.]